MGQGRRRDDLLDGDQHPAGRERGRGVHPARARDLDVSALVRPLGVQQVTASRPAERRRGQVLLGGLESRGEREGRPFAERYPLVLQGPAEQRRGTEDVQARKAELDLGDGIRAEQDFQRDAAAPAHVHEIARPPGGQRVQRRQRQPGQEGAADTHPVTVRHPGDEFGQADLRDLATRYARRLSQNRVTHVNLPSSETNISLIDIKSR
jgi:hypothetical protein